MNALIDQLTALRLHGMAACAHDLLSARKPPSLTTAIKQLIDAETVERRVRSIQYQMRIAKFPHHKDFATFQEMLNSVVYICSLNTCLLFNALCISSGIHQPLLKKCSLRIRLKYCSHRRIKGLSVNCIEPLVKRVDLLCLFV